MLQQTDRFKQDVQRYSQIINLLPDGPSKQEAQQLLNTLIAAVKNMDNMYLDMVYAKQLPGIGNEMKSDIQIIRKKLENKIGNKQ